MANVVDQSQKSFEAAKKYWSDIYNEAKADARFQSGKSLCQWDENLLKIRQDANLPVLQVDQLSQYVHQVVNDIRMNTPTINVIPSTGADQETAEIYRGLIRDIEYKSRADNAYDMAANNAVKTSIGFIRVDHDFENDEGLEQALFIKRVPNPLSCYLDDCVEPDGSDAMEGWVLETLSLDDFKKRYPGKAAVSFGDESKECREDGDVTIAEYFKIEETDRVLAYVDGQAVDYDESMGDVPVRTIKKRTVHRYILSGQDELESSTFPGIYIPIVPVYGEEAWVDNKREIYSLIRKSKQAQQAHNLWQSLVADSLTKQTGAKFMAAEGQVEDYAEDYANPHKVSVLRYRAVDSEGTPIGPPIALPPPPSPEGYINALLMSVDHIRATIGIYGAGVGDRSNEVSGVAIDSRKLEGDTATYHFGDNLIKSITHVGRILVHAVPDIYDTERIIRIVDMEDNHHVIGVNGQLVDGQPRTFDLRTGKYDVKVTTGTSYATKRQASADFYEKVIARNPGMFEIAGDLIFEYSDVEGAQALAKRMKKVIDPKLLEDGDDEQTAQLMGVIEDLRGQLGTMSAQLEEKNTKIAVEREKIQVDLEKTRIEAQIELQKMQIEREKLAYEQARLAVEQRGLAASQVIGTNVTI